MAIRIVQLGSERKKNEGMRIGAVRYPPRGVPKSRHSTLDFYDAWLPELSPSRPLLDRYKRTGHNEAQWADFKVRFSRELKKPPANRIVKVLAGLSHHADFSIGCYCEDENACHRSVLRKALEENGADVVRG